MSQEPAANPLEKAKELVLAAASSPLTAHAYRRAYREFFVWQEQQGRPPFNRATVEEYRGHLEARGMAPASVNQRLSALRQLAREAAHNGLLDAAAALGIRDVQNVTGVRARRRPAPLRVDPPAGRAAPAIPLSEDFPRWMYHRSKPAVVINSPEEEAALGPEWSRTVWPAKPPPAKR